MNLIIQYGLLGLVLGLGLGLGFILYCRIWRPLALPYMCPQPPGSTLLVSRVEPTLLTRVEPGLSGPCERVNPGSTRVQPGFDAHVKGVLHNM